ncbi:hypothetical protein J1N35_029341 [Gossypium stocksii]|uniref:Transposase MuDR plant domain-containing protein n=1 Tax=Gossypium stocksii TaxID=47602 RepID=A0A9D3UZW0_9ROSI|nr:hypothetical protein J1N35_029341 [Gossypium stocksii]
MLWEKDLLADVEPIENPAPLGEEHGSQESCIVVLISYLNSQSTVHGINIDLSVALDTDTICDDGYNSSDPSDHEVDSDSDLDIDKVSNDIDDENTNGNRNVNASSTGNQIRCTVTHNNPRTHMSLIDPGATHVTEFLKYPDILPAHWLAVDSDPEELFMGQKFKSKEECIFSIKRYSMNVSLDYKVIMSKLTLYIGECWWTTEGCNW